MIAKHKSQNLTDKHSLVCPSLIPLSPLALRNYEKESREQLKEWLQDIAYMNSKIGLAYNFYPLKEKGFDMAQCISRGDY